MHFYVGESIQVVAVYMHIVFLGWPEPFVNGVYTVFLVGKSPNYGHKQCVYTVLAKPTCFYTSDSASLCLRDIQHALILTSIKSIYTFPLKLHNTHAHMLIHAHKHAHSHAHTGSQQMHFLLAQAHIDHTHTHTSVHTQVNSRRIAHARTRTHTGSQHMHCLRAHAHTHTQVCTHRSTADALLTHARAHTHRFTADALLRRTHAHTHTHTHIHKCAHTGSQQTHFSRARTHTHIHTRAHTSLQQTHC